MDDGRDRTERQELHFFYPPSLQNYLSITVFATPSLFLVCLDLSCNKKITLKPVVRIVSNYLFNWQSGHRSLAILFSNHIFSLIRIITKCCTRCQSGHCPDKEDVEIGGPYFFLSKCCHWPFAKSAIGGGGGVQRLMANVLHFFSVFYPFPVVLYGN